MTSHEWLSLGLTNAVLATLLGVAGWLLTCLWRNPHVASAVWLVVLLKLVTPPVVSLPVPLLSPASESPAEALLSEIASDPVPLSLGERGKR